MSVFLKVFAEKNPVVNLSKDLTKANDQTLPIHGPRPWQINRLT